uniref:hypothetical protein n=1 Tax=Roseinatronobacter sp. TaxID=1945755 RepID=UPI0025F3327F
VAYALHTDGWSITEDGGFTWLYADLPYESQAFSVDENANFVIAKTDGRVVYLDANGADRTLDFSEEQVLEFPLTNGDFETGNTSGWVVATGDSVSVLKTKTPSQRPGSKYYLTRDANVSDADSEFQISQLFTVPASAAGRDIEVSADVYARTGALGRLRVTSIEGAIDRFTPEESEVDFRAQFRRVTGFTGGYSAIDQRSDAPSELEFTGDVAKLGAITTFRFELRVVDDPTLKERVQIVIDDALGNGSWTASANFDAPFNGISNSNLFNFNSSNGKRGRLKVGNLPIFNRVHP